MDESNASTHLPRAAIDLSKAFYSTPFRGFGWQTKDERNCFENAIRTMALILDGMPFRVGANGNSIKWFPYDEHDPLGHKYFRTNN